MSDPEIPTCTATHTIRCTLPAGHLDGLGQFKTVPHINGGVAWGDDGRASDPEIPDEAVEAAARGAWRVHAGWTWERLCAEYPAAADDRRARARAALTAALPALRRQWVDEFERRLRNQPPATVREFGEGT